MSKTSDYRLHLRQIDDWDAYMMAESGLPGPRGNLELAQAAADEGDEPRFRRWLAFGPEVAPANSAGEFLPVCGVIGLGRLLAEGEQRVLVDIRPLAADPRWRVREGVAMALQRWGDANMRALLEEMEGWCAGSAWEQRAGAAALCEPRLLRDPESARQTLALLDRITERVTQAEDRKQDSFRVLRQALGYAWSVAVVALPDAGKTLMEKWLLNCDPDVRWIMRENLKKNRLSRMDANWVAAWTPERVS